MRFSFATSLSSFPFSAGFACACVVIASGFAFACACVVASGLICVVASALIYTGVCVVVVGLAYARTCVVASGLGTCACVGADGNFVYESVAAKGGFENVCVMSGFANGLAAIFTSGF